MINSLIQRMTEDEEEMRLRALEERLAIVQEQNNTNLDLEKN